MDKAREKAGEPKYKTSKPMTDKLSSFVCSLLPQSFQEAAQASSKAFLDQGPEKAKKYSEAYASLFPYATLSEAGEAIQKDGNTVVASALSATTNLLGEVSSDLNMLEQYINLTIPKMEDGNNFGVTVQLALLKQISDSREKVFDAALEDLMKYSSSRADALEKCKEPSTSITETSTTSESNSQENTEEKSSKSSSKETKTVVSKSEPTSALTSRQNAVTAVDVLYYNKAKSAYFRALTAYLSSLDFYDKNQEKISAPKGSRGGGGYSSMY